MTDGLKSTEERELRARVEQVRGKLQGLSGDLRVVDDEVERLAPQRKHHELLNQVCSSLEELEKLGAASLFWGERIQSAEATAQMRDARMRLGIFQTQVGELDARRSAILTKISGEEQVLENLGEDLYELREQEERRKLEWIVERDINPIPRRAQVMAWARGGEDDKRFRKSLALALLASLFLGVLLPLIRLPLPRPFHADAMPKRLVQLVREEQAKPLPPPPMVAEKQQNRPQDQKQEATAEPKRSGQPGPLPKSAGYAAAGPPSDPGGPLAPETPGFPTETPQQKVGKAGILAFRDQFASLAKDKVAPRLGADARFRDADDAAQGQTTRSMLTTNAPGSSGGINLASLSRNLGGGGGRGPGGGGGGALHGDGGGGGGFGGGGGAGGGLPIGRATSPIASIGGGADRPKAHGGPGPSRTDEEIQIVFDRYKASFYRLYNRELRNNPALQGQMVLRLTIEPDGSVSMCMLQSTDMDAAQLAAQVVNRVRTINFGAKEGVQAVTIVYPIDFLPAA